MQYLTLNFIIDSIQSKNKEELWKNMFVST